MCKGGVSSVSEVRSQSSNGNRYRGSRDAVRKLSRVAVSFLLSLVKASSVSLDFGFSMNVKIVDTIDGSRSCGSLSSHPNDVKSNCVSREVAQD